MVPLLKSSKTVERFTLPKLSRHFVNNPSILFVDDKLYVVYKGINYDFKIGGHRNKKYAGFTVPFSDSQNYFATLNLNGEIRLEESGFLEDRHIRSHRKALSGLEDIRLFSWQGEIHGLAAAHTYRQSRAEGAMPVKKTSMLLCRISGRDLIPLGYLPSRQEHEKNWMPWVKEDELYFIYNSDPYEVLHVRDEAVVDIISPQTHPGLQSQWGGSSVVPLGRNYIGIVHRKNSEFVLDRGPDHPVMSYSHSVVIYAENFDVLDVSPPFTFEEERVEFCCGIAMKGEHVILSYGIWDNEAVIVRMELREFLELMSLGKWL